MLTDITLTSLPSLYALKKTTLKETRNICNWQICYPRRGLCMSPSLNRGFASRLQMTSPLRTNFLFCFSSAVRCYNCTSCNDPFNKNGVSTMDCGSFGCMKTKADGSKYTVRLRMFACSELPVFLLLNISLTVAYIVLICYIG